MPDKPAKTAAACAEQADPARAAQDEQEIERWPIEKCFEELEQIVKCLESETTSLEDSLKLFERGMKLSRRCSRELTTIERKIQMILETADGKVEMKDFDAGASTAAAREETF